MQSKIVLSSLLASAVSANSFMAHPLMKRNLLAPRQTEAVGGLSGDCQEAILEVYQSLPTPPPAIVEDLTENPQTDACDFSVPASLSKDYASYSADIVSWYGENADQISSALEECPELAQFATAVPVCSTGANAGGKPDATSTAAGSDDDDATSSAAGSKPDTTSTAAGSSADTTSAAGSDDDDATSSAAGSSADATSAARPTTTSASGDSDSDDTDEADATPTESDSPAQVTNGAAREGGLFYAAAAVAGLVVAAL
ncbi:hypothetical protein F66182_496 [Fusarium sp. NRRL 66182]|nr:hypothetical protein F66182_496 [Fusarium sp. NRRL 66182]